MAVQSHNVTLFDQSERCSTRNTEISYESRPLKPHVKYSRSDVICGSQSNFMWKMNVVPLVV